MIELSRSPNEFFNHFWIQVAVSEEKQPLRNRFGSETGGYKYPSVCGGYVTEISARSGVAVV
jgi:hypothetical protein